MFKMPKIRSNKAHYSVQEATQLIMMDSDSDEDDIDLGENLGEDSEKDSDWEADEEDID